MSGHGHHAHHGLDGQNPPTQALAAVGGNQPPFYALCKANGQLFVLDGAAVLAPTNPSDGAGYYYPWDEYKEATGHGAQIEGNPVFDLVNKDYGLAIKHSLGQSHPVMLVPFDPAVNLDQYVMCTENGDAFCRIRAVNNTRLNSGALNGDKFQGGVDDGTAVVLWDGAKGDYQSLKIVPWIKESYFTTPRGGRGSLALTFRISCKADENFSATARKGTVVLEPTDPRDQCQRWFKDMRHSNSIKDEEGYPAFALVNKFTREAIKHSEGERHPVKLVKYKYDPDYADESVLWTESPDVGGGFGCIRMANNIRLQLAALNGKVTGKAIKHSQCFDHPISNHYCSSCLQKRLRLLKK